MGTKDLTSQKEIENRIFTIRDKQVMIDRDLAEMYEVRTKVLNQAVKRNSDRFPEAFRFQLSKEETSELVTNCDRFDSLKHSSTNPYVFTEQGVAMLSSVLHSDVEVKVSIEIMNAFVEIRKIMLNHASLFQRMDRMETKQIKTDQKLKIVFKALESKQVLPNKDIFFDGQIFDAYTFIADLIRQAKASITMIYNYIDDTVFTLFTKRKKGVAVTFYTRKFTKQLKLDAEKHNAQYPPVQLKELKVAHDRFLIIDKTDLYHIGASLKDLGKKWFAFSKMDIETVDVLKKLEE